MKKVLIIANHYANRSPGQRFRFEQYLEFLNANGFECKLSNIITPEDDKYFYKDGYLGHKVWIIFKALRKRIRDILKIKEYDLVLLFREALPISSIFVERQLKKRGAKLIFDFDDSIWLNNVSKANKAFSFLKNAKKTSHLIGMSDMVFAGNNYLGNYASQFNKNVKIIPTTIDTLEYQRKKIVKPDNKICIGWSGSITTIQHFEYAIPALKEVKSLFGDKVYFKVIGDRNYKNEALDIQGVPWKKATELEDLSEIDIGIMPLPDDDWSKGKCGLKGLQYMALEIATIMSPVGVNSQIIEDGKNGFLAGNKDEWVEKITRLIQDHTLRKKLGKAGRKTVEDRFSVEANKTLYLKYFNELIA